MQLVPALPAPLFCQLVLSLSKVWCRVTSLTKTLCITSATISLIESGHAKHNSQKHPHTTSRLQYSYTQQ